MIQRAIAPRLFSQHFQGIFGDSQVAQTSRQTAIHRQLGDRGDQIADHLFLRTSASRDPKRPPNPRIAFWFGGGVEGNDVGQENRIDQAVVNWKMTASRVGHRVNRAQIGIGKRDPGHRRRDQHLATRFFVFRAVVGRVAQIIGDDFNRAQRQRIAHRLVFGGNIGFDGVSQRVHARGSGQMCWQRRGYFGIQNRQFGANIWAGKREFNLVFVVQNHRKVADFGASSRRRRNRHHRNQRALQNIYTFVIQ